LGEKRIPSRNGSRREASCLGVMHAFAWTDPADLLFEGVYLYT
jgi:hypothetical protein